MDYSVFANILGFFAAFAAIATIISLAYAIFMIIVYWKIFKKAGRNGWESIIPIYNGYVMYDIAGKAKSFWIILAISVVQGLIGNTLISFIASIAIIVLCVKVYLALANKFGHSGAFAVGLILIPVVFFPILAFGSSQYINDDIASDTVINDENKSDI